MFVSSGCFLFRSIARGDPAQGSDLPGERLEQAVDVVLGGEPAQGHAQRTAGADGVEAHGREHIRRFAGVVGAAGAARRHGDAGVVEREQQADGVGLLAREAEAQKAGQAPVRVADEVGVAVMRRTDSETRSR